MAKQVKMTVRYTVPLEGALVDCIDLIQMIIKHRLEENPVQMAEVITLALAAGITKDEMLVHKGGLLYGIRYLAKGKLEEKLIKSAVIE